MAVSENKEVYGGFASVNLRKPDLMQEDPKKGDYVKGKEEFLAQAGAGQNPIDPEDIAEAVADYMAENPVSAEVGDGTVTRAKLAKNLEPFVGTGDSREAPNQYGYGWYYDHTRRTAANILGEMHRTKLANELADADTIVLEQEGDALVHNLCIAEDYANSRIYAVYAVSTDGTDNAGSTNCYVRLSVITNPYTKASRTVAHYKVSGNGQYGDLNIISGTSDANVYVDANGVVHIWFNATDQSGIWKIAHCTFDPNTGTFADYEWCTLTVGENEATQLTGDALTSISDPSITYQKGASLQMNGKYCVFDGYLYAGNCSGEVTRNGMILRTLATDCKNWEFVCCPAWQHESHGKCELSIGDSSPYNQSLFIALRQVYQSGANVAERASAPLLVAQVDRQFNIQTEWLVPDCASRPWWIGQSTLIHNPESRQTANVVAIGANAWPISFERIGYANYLAGFISNGGWGNRLVLAGTNGSGKGSKVGISILTDTKLIINSYAGQKTSEAAAMEYFKGIGGVSNKPLTFTGAVSATYDGTKAVTVNIPQASSGGGSAEWVTLGDVTTTEEQTEVAIAFDPRKINRLAIYAVLVGTEANAEEYQLAAYIGGNNRLLGTGAVQKTATTRYGKVLADLTPIGTFFHGSYAQFDTGAPDSPNHESFFATLKNTTELSTIKFTAGTNYAWTGGTFGVGTRFIVMAQ